MKKIIVPLAILSVFTSIGCLNDSNTKIQRTEPTPATVAPLIVDTNANKILAAPASSPAAPIIAKPVSTTGLNPAHGQPGHRCDISVGAPLDSKPVQTTIQTPQIATKPTTTTITPTTATPVSSPSVTGNGLNPAHGQPGHRCDIAVGAPLNSSPAK